MPGALYLDSSALVKTIVREPESAPLRRLLRRHTVHVSCALARAEVTRVVGRARADAISLAQRALERLVLLQLDDPLLARAGALHPPGLRTLDAIHLAAAQLVGPELVAVVTYDERMTEGAHLLSLPVQAPV